MTDLVAIQRNDLKATEKTQVIVFGIEINTKNFIVKFLDEKYEKVIKVTTKVLAK